jgi:SAM-dependent methyltransferase
MLKRLKNLVTGDSYNKAIQFQGLNLPKFRSNQGLNGNEEYVNSGAEQVAFMRTNNLISNSTSMLDFGCGQGRIVNALEYSKTEIKNYTGVDTDNRALEWCKKHLRYNGTYNFIHLPAFNARYNKSAQGLQTLPFEELSFDLIFLNSVFSHMTPEDVVFYLHEFHRMLNENGAVYITAFIEENVTDFEENPENYMGTSSGALHRVRFSQNYFNKLIDQCQFKVDSFHHQEISRTGQSVVVLRKK